MSFFYYLRRGEILMLGDTTAHINIARRVFDSLDPGPLRLGTVWLPLPHIVMIPFLISDKMWQSGIGGSIPSMVAYIFGVMGVFRLATALLSSQAFADGEQNATRYGPYIAAFAYGANPNLLYMQATALTETLYLAFFIWATVYFADWLAGLQADGARSERAQCALRRSACCVACAELTRYDGWFLAGVFALLAGVIAARNWRDGVLRRRTFEFLVYISAAPALWLAYNAAFFGSPLAFARGPYSAKAIEARVGAPIPGAHNLWVAGSYFLKSAQITLAVGNWGRFWLLTAAVATAILVWKKRRNFELAALALLWSPVAFYGFSIAYNSVPLHVPMWWPFAVFNQRFGLELLPLFAVSAGILVERVLNGRLAAHRWKVIAAAVALIVTSYAFVLAAKPLCWVEAWRNWEMRRGLDTAVERAMKQLPPDSLFLMDLEEHVGVLERAGIPLRRVVNNEDHRPWRQPDPEGLWERTLADPGRYVNYVIDIEGDLVDRGVNRVGLTLLEVIHSPGRPVARIYRTGFSGNQSR